MNLVVDDAVEVKQATKTDEEKRRRLGKDLLEDGFVGFANIRHKAKYFSKEITYL